MHRISITCRNGPDAPFNWDYKMISQVMSFDMALTEPCRVLADD